jgi:lysyl-tRNA synthetase class I
VDTTTEEIVEKMLLKFTSGNDVEVTRASFTRDEIDTLIFCVSRWYASAQAYREETEELREVKKNITAKNERLRELLRELKSQIANSNVPFRYIHKIDAVLAAGGSNE